MAKNKVKAETGTKKQQGLITQQQRNNNPIFKVIYKRIRNLNKKLSNIDSLLELDQASLKPEQVSKIQGRPQVEAQIKKNQQFALYYKGILDECGGASFDNSQDLIKIATLIAVGQNIDKYSNAGDDHNLHHTHKTSYKNIIQQNVHASKQLVDRIGDVFGVLTTYLKDPAQYRALQDYISYMNRGIEDESSKTQKSQKSSKVEKKETKQTKKNKEQESKKQERKQVVVQKKQQSKKVQTTQHVTESVSSGSTPAQTSTPNANEKKVQENKPARQEKLEVTQAKPGHTTEKVQIVTMKPNKEVVVTQESQPKVENQSKQEKNPDQAHNQSQSQSKSQSQSQNEKVQKSQSQVQKQATKQQQTSKQNGDRYNNNRGYNNNRKYNNNNNNYNNNQTRPYNNYNNRYNNSNNYRNRNENNNQYENRYTNGSKNYNKYDNYQKQDTNTKQYGKKTTNRKDSDTSLEPTPQKKKPIRSQNQNHQNNQSQHQKTKYVQKQ